MAETQQLDTTTKLDKARLALSNLKDKNFKLIFFVPGINNTPSGAIIETYTQAAILRREGFDARILVEKQDEPIPTYLDQDLQAIPHLYSDGAAFDIRPEDWLIIPDFFTPMMEQTKNLPCSRIVLAQNLDFIVTKTLGGMTWKDMNIKNVLTTSSNMKEFIERFHGKSYDIQTYTLGIPDYFKPQEFRKPIIGFHVRNESDIERVSKMFYALHPELQWVVFKPLHNKSREEFAQELGEVAVCLWMDSNAAFGQTPIEAMKTQTPVVGLIPHITPEYMVENSGVWLSDYYQIPEMLGRVFKMWLQDVYPTQMTTKADEVAAKYNPEENSTSVMSAYTHFFSEREALLQEVIEIEEKREATLLAAVTASAKA